MKIIIEHPNDENKEYRIEIETVNIGNVISIFRYDGEGFDVGQNEIYEIIDDWFKKNDCRVGTEESMKIIRRN